MKQFLGSVAVASLLITATPVTAGTMIGGYTFDDNAFADTLISSSGSYSTSGGSLASVLTDTNAGTWAGSLTPNAYVELGFTDNWLVNGAGADLVLFELGIPSIFKVSITIGGTTLSYASQDTGFDAGGYNLNAAEINLDDFGVASGASLSSIAVRMDDGSNTRPSLSLVGALNSRAVDATVPEPASLVLIGLGFAALRLSRRKAKNQ